MGWRFWAELFVRSGVLLVGAEVLRRASRSAGASFRHRLLVWTFMLLALMPLFSVLFPEIPVSLGRAQREVKALVTVQEVFVKESGKRGERGLNWPLAIWLTGFVGACVPLAVGTYSARGMAGRALKLEASEFGELWVSSDLLVPVTCGVLRPRIVLPAAAISWSAARLEAVVLHELAHVRRRDLMAQAAAHVIAALWWFQPLVWVMRQKLRQESEFACDAEVIRAGVKPSTYAAELLAVAEAAKRNWRISSSVIGMVRPSGLEERLRVILRPKSRRFGGSGIFVVCLVLGAVSIAASTVNVVGGESLEGEKGSTMKRTILSALLTSAGLSAATVSGYIHDASGNAVTDAKVSIYHPDNSSKQTTTTGEDGKFSFGGSDGGQYILRVEKAGFASIFREFDLKADSTMNRAFTMTAEGGSGVADEVIGAESDRKKAIRIGGQVAQSNLVFKVQPIYPGAAKKTGVQGTVELESTISRDGVPMELRVISSPSDDLSESAVEAVRQWRYRPTLLNGEPIEVQTVVVVNYTLSR